MGTNQRSYASHRTHLAQCGIKGDQLALWPTGNLPEMMCGGTTTLRALIREYLFISLFRACAESLASENASRLAAIESADKNINELLENLDGQFHRLRQSGIDEELFDVVSGFEALVAPRVSTKAQPIPTDPNREREM